MPSQANNIHLSRNNSRVPSDVAMWKAAIEARRQGKPLTSQQLQGDNYNYHEYLPERTDASQAYYQFRPALESDYLYYEPDKASQAKDKEGKGKGKGKATAVQPGTNSNKTHQQEQYLDAEYQRAMAMAYAQSNGPHGGDRSQSQLPQGKLSMSGYSTADDEDRNHMSTSRRRLCRASALHSKITQGEDEQEFQRAMALAQQPQILNNSYEQQKSRKSLPRLNLDNIQASHTPHIIRTLDKELEKSLKSWSFEERREYDIDSGNLVSPVSPLTLEEEMLLR